MRVITLILAIFSTQVMTPEFCASVICGESAQKVEAPQGSCMKKACCKMKQSQPEEKRQNKSSCSACPKKLIAIGPEITTRFDVLLPVHVEIVEINSTFQIPRDEVFERIEHPPPRKLFCVWRI